MQRRRLRVAVVVAAAAEAAVGARRRRRHEIKWVVCSVVQGREGKEEKRKMGDFKNLAIFIG
jgi:hypothetical protein